MKRTVAESKAGEVLRPVIEASARIDLTAGICLTNEFIRTLYIYICAYFSVGIIFRSVDIYFGV